MEIKFKQIETGCIIPISHQLNQDGYFRKYINGRLVMYHRYEWEEVNGEIPKGYEIDHLCKNRACCNVEHLQLLSSSEHRTKDNTGRNKERKDKAFVYWINNPSVSGVELGELYSVSFSTGCKWIREWKQEEK